MISEPRSLRLLLQAEGLSHVKAGKLEERDCFLKRKSLTVVRVRGTWWEGCAI